MTVSNRHDIKFEGLMDSIKAIRSKEEGQLPICLYFVVPPDVYDTFKIQKITYKDKAVKSTVSIDQYALRMDFDGPNAKKFFTPFNERELDDPQEETDAAATDEDEVEEPDA